MIASGCHQAVVTPGKRGCAHARDVHANRLCNGLTMALLTETPFDNLYEIHSVISNNNYRFSISRLMRIKEACCAERQLECSHPSA
jgi:hypothetical protein